MESQHTCKVEIRLDAGPDKVWKALTDPDLVQKYFYGTRVESDWAVGSPVRWRGQWQGKTYEDKGEVLASEPGKRLGMTYWSSMSGMEDRPENYMTVFWDLVPDGSGTRLTVTQGKIRSAEVAAHSEEGWRKVVAGLKDLLEEETLVPYRAGPGSMDTDLGS